jgi:hypothetical protein
MGFLPVYFYFIALSFVASLSVYFTGKTNYSFLKLFPPFLAATIIVEILGSYFSSIGENNVELYNFFTSFEFCFYLWILSRIIKKKELKKIIGITIVVFLISAIINILFIQGIQTFHTVTYSLGCLLIVIFCIYYFLELFRLPKSEKLYTNPSFWICAALLFFYCCGFPLYALINLWGKISKLVVHNFTNIVTIFYAAERRNLLCHHNRHHIGIIAGRLHCRYAGSI